MFKIKIINSGCGYSLNYYDDRIPDVIENNDLEAYDDAASLIFSNGNRFDFCVERNKVFCNNTEIEFVNDEYEISIYETYDWYVLVQTDNIFELKKWH